MVLKLRDLDWRYVVMKEDRDDGRKYDELETRLRSVSVNPHAILAPPPTPPSGKKEDRATGNAMGVSNFMDV